MIEGIIACVIAHYFYTSTWVGECWSASSRNHRDECQKGTGHTAGPPCGTNAYPRPQTCRCCGTSSWRSRRIWRRTAPPASPHRNCSRQKRRRRSSRNPEKITLEESESDKFYILFLAEKRGRRNDNGQEVYARRLSYWILLPYQSSPSWRIYKRFLMSLPNIETYKNASLWSSNMNWKSSF